jgi:hypothetical protein
MTNLADFDRSLAEFLADGPNTAPEAPVIAALAHARTTPRRPDPLRAFRPDVMGLPRRVFGLRPGFVLAAAALGLALIGVAVVGSRQNQVAPPEPAPSVLPAASPAATPSPFSALVTMLVSAGQPYAVTVSDVTGELVDAVSVQPGDGATIGDGDVRIAADPSNPHALVVTWQGIPCETEGSLLVDETANLVDVTRRACQSGDQLPLDRIVRLTFDSTVAPDDWTGSIVAAPTPSATTSGENHPIGSPAVPPVRVALEHDGGEPLSIDIVDESGLLVSAVTGQVPDTVDHDSFDAFNDTPMVVRLTWAGSPCDTVHRLTIDRDLTTMTLDRPHCFGDAIATYRALVLTFSQPIDATSLRTSLREGRGGVDMPAWTAAGPDSNDGGYHLSLTDPAYIVDAIDAGFDPEGAIDPGSSAIQLVQIDPMNVRMVWRAPACASTLLLTVDPSGDNWALASARCEPLSPTVIRMLTITLREPRDINSIDIEMLSNLQ